MPSIRGVVDDIETALEEDQGVAAVLGGLGGLAGAFLAERYGPDPDPDTFAITIDQARASLLSALALVFTGLRSRIWAVMMKLAVSEVRANTMLKPVNTNANAPSSEARAIAAARSCRRGRRRRATS